MDWEARTDACIEKYRSYVSPGLANLMKFGGFGALEVAAEGCVVRDCFGTEYLDFLGGYGTQALGHRHPRVLAAVREALEGVPLSTRTFFSEAVGDLAEALALAAPGRLRYTFFCHSGAEAVEGALKAARIASGRPGVIAAAGGYHGKTLGALSASGRDKYKTPFAPLVPGFTHVPFADAAAIEGAVTADTGAVLLEPIQGEAGVIVPPDSYLPAVRDICDRHDLLLILDEVQTGLGRTGRMFAAQWSGVAPDILCLAKALGGGVEPLAAFMGTPEVWERFFGQNPLIHTTTIVSNVAMRVGLETLRVLQEERLPERAAELGERLISGLRSVQAAHPETIADVRGRGLLVGVETHNEDVGLLIIGALANRGVIVAYTLNNPRVIRFEPPLIVSESQIDQAVDVFDAAVGEAESMLKDLQCP